MTAARLPHGVQKLSTGTSGGGKSQPHIPDFKSSPTSVPATRVRALPVATGMHASWTWNVDRNASAARFKLAFCTNRGARSTLQGPDISRVRRRLLRRLMAVRGRWPSGSDPGGYPAHHAGRHANLKVPPHTGSRTSEPEPACAEASPGPTGILSPRSPACPDPRPRVATECTP